MIDGHKIDGHNERLMGIMKGMIRFVTPMRVMRTVTRYGMTPARVMRTVTRYVMKSICFIFAILIFSCSYTFLHHGLSSAYYMHIIAHTIYEKQY